MVGEPQASYMASGVATETASQTAESVVEEGGAWPRTNRVLPWLVSIFLMMLWLVPFDSITARFSLGVDSKLDRIVLVVMAGIWLLIAVSRSRHGPRYRRTPLTVALVLFVGLAVISVAHNLSTLSNLDVTGLDVTGLAAKKLALLFTYAIFCYLTTTVVRRSEVRNFLMFMVILAALTALGTIWEYRTGGSDVFYTWAKSVFKGFNVAQTPPVLDASGRVDVVGPTQTPLADTTILAIALPFALMFFFQARTWRIKLLWYLAFGLILAGAVATGRKTAIVIPAATLVALGLYAPKRMFRFLPGLVIFVLLIRVITPHAISSILYQFESGGSSSSTLSRTSDYPAVTPDILTHPVFGRGFGTYDPTVRILDNEYLQLLVETGFAGLAGYVILLATGLGIAHKAARSKDPLRGPPGVALVAAIIGFAVASATYDVLGFPQAPYLLFFVLALAVVAADRPGAIKSAVPRRCEGQRAPEPA